MIDVLVAVPEDRDSVRALVVVLAVIRPQGPFKPKVPGLRPALLLALALLFYFALPMDVTGYMYALYPRYAQVAALLAIPVLPFPLGKLSRVFVAAATLLALYSGVNLAVLFSRFDVEAENFEMVARRIPKGSRIMHLVLDRGSRYATHAVYLHYAALAALRSDGVPSFSLATDPSFPVGYRPGAQPPAPPWEWQPERFTWDEARWYDCFLVRGEVLPEALFGEHASEVELDFRAEKWRLYMRRRQPLQGQGAFQ